MKKETTKSLKRKFKAPIATLFIYLLSACSTDYYCKYIELPNSIWRIGKAYEFTFDVPDNSVVTDVTFKLRCNSYYPYSGIVFKVEKMDPQGNISRDTISYALRDSLGKWKGKGISTYEHDIPIERNFRFKQSGMYTYSFEQIMDDTKLKGVQDVGLQVQSNK